VIHGIAENVSARVKEANEKIARYVEDSEAHGRTTAIEFLFNDLSLQLLAFAFGLGIGRRTIDLYLTLPAPFKKPVQQLEYALYRRWIWGAPARSAPKLVRVIFIKSSSAPGSAIASELAVL
jgi:hypothetical protein